MCVCSSTHVCMRVESRGQPWASVFRQQPPRRIGWLLVCPQGPSLASASPVLELQICTAMPNFSTWALGIEPRSLCLRDEHFSKAELAPGTLYVSDRLPGVELLMSYPDMTIAHSHITQQKIFICALIAGRLESAPFSKSESGVYLWQHACILNARAPPLKEI